MKAVQELTECELWDEAACAWWGEGRDDINADMWDPICDAGTALKVLEWLAKSCDRVEFDDKKEEWMSGSNLWCVLAWPDGSGPGDDPCEGIGASLSEAIVRAYVAWNRYFHAVET